MTREDVERWVEENQIELALLEGMDSAIVGIVDDGLDSPKVVYSKRKIFKALQDQGMSEDDAEEWYSYNTVRALPYMGKIAPCVMDDLWYPDPEAKVAN